MMRLLKDKVSAIVFFDEQFEYENMVDLPRATPTRIERWHRVKTRLLKTLER